MHARRRAAAGVLLLVAAFASFLRNDGAFGCGCALDAASLWGHSARAAARVGAPQRRGPPGALEQIGLGAWHLGLATGRAACAPRGSPLTSEALSLLRADLERFRHGVDAAAGCPAARAAHASLIALIREPLSPEPAGSDAALRRFEALHREYERIVHEAPCGASASEIVLRNAAVSAGRHLASAAARLACAIDTWNQPLAHGVARAVDDDLAGARDALARLDAGSGSGALAQLALLRQQVPTARGDDLYGLVLRVFESVRAALRHSPS
jgi:hypothetical protein